MRIECPTCQTVLEDVPPDFPTRPFCCSRCKLIDLVNWLDERYRVSTPANPELMDEELLN